MGHVEDRAGLLVHLSGDRKSKMVARSRSYPVYGFRLYPENNGDSTKALRMERERLKVLLW